MRKYVPEQQQQNSLKSGHITLGEHSHYQSHARNTRFKRTIKETGVDIMCGVLAILVRYLTFALSFPPFCILLSSQKYFSIWCTTKGSLTLASSVLQSMKNQRKLESGGRKRGRKVILECLCIDTPDSSSKCCLFSYLSVEVDISCQDCPPEATALLQDSTNLLSLLFFWYRRGNCSAVFSTGI